MLQVDSIAVNATNCRMLLRKLAACCHAPHRDQPQAVIDAAADFIAHLHRDHSAGGG